MAPVYIEGDLSGRGLRVDIVVARFNGFITERLLEGAVDALKRHGVDDDDIRIARVPGSWEIAAVARRLANGAEPPDAIICLGAIIRGATDHYDVVVKETAKNIGALGVEGPVPVIFGVLTCDTLEQAIDRAGAKAGNKGAEAAISAIEMANLYQELTMHTGSMADDDDDFMSLMDEDDFVSPDGDAEAAPPPSTDDDDDKPF